MSTPLTDAINALTTYANEVTGGSDTTLSAAVATLAAGYGGGGGMDDYEDFSAGNIQALISHGTEYILTDYSGSMIGIFSAKIADPSVTRYEGYWSMEYNHLTPIGLQRYQANASIMQMNLYNVSYNKTVTSFGNGEPTIFTVSSIGNAEATANHPLVIFGNYYLGSLESAHGDFTFYGLNIVNESGVYAARFMPWLDDNSVPCVKDLVSGTIYYNSGSGTFDYIDSNGNTVTS